MVRVHPGPPLIFKFAGELKNEILNLGVKKIDYLDALDIVKNTKFTKRTKKFKLFIAYYLRDIRLIDNI